MGRGNGYGQLGNLKNVQHNILFELRETRDPYGPSDAMPDFTRPLGSHQTPMEIGDQTQISSLIKVQMLQN